MPYDIIQPEVKAQGYDVIQPEGPGVGSQGGTAPRTMSLVDTLTTPAGLLGSVQQLVRMPGMALTALANQATRLQNRLTGSNYRDLNQDESVLTPLRLDRVRSYVDPTQLLNKIPAVRKADAEFHQTNPNLAKVLDITSGAPEAGAKAVEGLVTPTNIGLMGLGPIAKGVGVAPDVVGWIHKLLGAYFGVEGASDVVPAAEQTVRAALDPTKTGQQTLEQGSRTLSDVLMLLGGPQAFREAGPQLSGLKPGEDMTGGLRPSDRLRNENTQINIDNPMDTRLRFRNPAGYQAPQVVNAPPVAPAPIVRPGAPVPTPLETMRQLSAQPGAAASPLQQLLAAAMRDPNTFAPENVQVQRGPTPVGQGLVAGMAEAGRPPTVPEAGPEPTAPTKGQPPVAKPGAPTVPFPPNRTPATASSQVRWLQPSTVYGPALEQLLDWVSKTNDRGALKTLADAWKDEPISPRRDLVLNTIRRRYVETAEAAGPHQVRAAFTPEVGRIPKGGVSQTQLEQERVLREFESPNQEPTPPVQTQQAPQGQAPVQPAAQLPPGNKPINKGKIVSDLSALGKEGGRLLEVNRVRNTSGGKASSSYTSIVSKLGRVGAWMKSVGRTELVPGVMRDYFKAIEDKNSPFYANPATRDTYRTTLMSAFSHLKSDDPLKPLYDEIKGVEKTGVKHVGKEPLTQDVARRILDKLDEKAKAGGAKEKMGAALYRFLLQTGVRPGAISELRRKDLDMTTGKVKVYGKSEDFSQDYQSEVGPGALDAIREYLRAAGRDAETTPQNANELLFQTEQGKAVAGNRINEMLGEVESGVSAYNVRKAAGTGFYHRFIAEKGAGSDLAAARFLGHTDAELKSVGKYIKEYRLGDELDPLDPEFWKKYEELKQKAASEPPKARTGGRLYSLPGALFDSSVWKPAVDFGRAIARTVKDFSTWSGHMISQFGQGIAQHLKALWEHITSGSEAGSINPEGNLRKQIDYTAPSKPMTLKEIREAAERGKPKVEAAPVAKRPVQDPKAPLRSTPETKPIVQAIQKAHEMRARLTAQTGDVKTQLAKLKQAASLGKTTKMEKKLGIMAQPGEETPKAQSVEKLTDYAAKVQNAYSATGRAISPVDVMADICDGGKGEFNGWIMQNIRKPLDDMFNETLKVRDAMSDPLVKSVKDLGLGYKTGRRIGTFAHTQQAGGEKALLRSGVDQSTIDQLKRTGLSQPEATWLAKARNVMEALRPEIARVLAAVHGRKLLLEENYFPRQRDQKKFEPGVADQDLTRLPGGEEVSADVISSEPFDKRVSSSSTESGFTMPRVPDGKQLIKLNAFEVVERHIRDVAHFVGMEEMLAEKMKLIKSKEFENAYGKTAQRYWMDWLDTVATQNRNSLRIAFLDYFRQKSTLAIIPFRVSSQFVHLANIPLAVLHTGGEGGMVSGLKWWLKGVYEAHTPQGQEFLKEHFRESFERGGGEPTITELTKSGRTTRGKVAKVGFGIQRFLDQTITQGTVLGSYMRRLAEDGKNADLYHEVPVDTKSVQAARVDSRRAVASPLPKDVPWILSKGGSAGKTFFQFQNTFLDQWSNIRHELIRVGLSRLAEGDPKLALRVLVAVSGLLAIETGIKFQSRQKQQQLVRMEPKKDDTFIKKFEEEALKRVPFSSLVMGLWRSTNPDASQVGTGVPALDIPVEAVAKTRQLSTASGRRVPLASVEAAGSIAEVAGATGAGQLTELAGNWMRGRLQKATETEQREMGEKLGYGQGPYTLQERYYISRALKQTKAPDTLEDQRRRAILADRAQYLRRTELTTDLPQEQQDWLKKRNLLVSGFKYTIEVGGQSIQLTRPEQAFYRAKLQEELSKRLEAEMSKPVYDRLSPEMQKKRWDYVQREAHKYAELETARAIKSGSISEPNQPKARYSAFSFANQ